MRRLAILIPRFEFGTLKGNHHIWRKGKFGWRSGTRRKGWSIVRLGLGYPERHTYGWRLWRYRRDGSCWNVGVYFWDGRQHGVAS